MTARHRWTSPHGKATCTRCGLERITGEPGHAAYRAPGERDYTEGAGRCYGITVARVPGYTIGRAQASAICEACKARAVGGASDGIARTTDYLVTLDSGRTVGLCDHHAERLLLTASMLEQVTS